MRRSHFAAFAPLCPVCRRDRGADRPLTLATIRAEQDDDIRAGVLLCSDPACQHEYPIIDGIPIIMPQLRQHLAARGLELLLRDDLDPLVWSMLGDALGPESWLDAIRQNLSTYGWDAYADLDPAEPENERIRPGAARACLARLLELAGPRPPPRRVLDLGCAAGRTSFDLAGQEANALVLGIDSNLALLRLARRALSGEISYDRRRIGVVYDHRSFTAALPASERVDFWAADALALPFASASADLVCALNVLDCVPQPQRLLAGMAEVLQPGGTMLLATPFDWAQRATPMETWIGGHSQRAPHHGSGEGFLATLLTAGAHPQSVVGLRLLGTADMPWQTRLHERATVSYLTYLVALERKEGLLF